MNKWPGGKRAIILVALVVSLLPEGLAVVAGQGAKSLAQAWRPVLVIGAIQAVLLVLYVVLTVRRSK
ncbi:MAG: hypothetical protein ABSF45_20955 [Terriglobia bacterium]